MGGYYSGRLNFAVFRNPLLLAFGFIYILHSVFRHFFPAEPWFLQYYLNDLLCMPLVLGAAIFAQRNLVLRQPAYKLTCWQIGLTVVYFSVMFEGIIPLFVSRYTADLFDVICYGLGGVLFYISGNANKTNLVQKISLSRTGL